MSLIIPVQTAAKTSENIDLRRGPFPKTITGAGTIGALETIAVNVVTVVDGVVIGSAVPLYDSTGSAVVISATSQPITIPSPIVLQFVKGITAAAAGVNLVEIRE